MTWLVAQDLARTTDPRPRRVRSARASDSRMPYSVLLTMPQAMRARLEAAARRDLRSVSGFVGRVVLEVLGNTRSGV